MSMNIDRVGVELWSGAESMGFELTSDFLSVTIADLGAHLASVIMRVGHDEELEITVGYPSGATSDTGFHGASVGRYANRIAGAKFSLDGDSYEVEANDGNNQLHGGPDGFGVHAWSADAETAGGAGKVVLKHKSKDGDMGYPGKVQATAIFELQDNQLTIDYHAKVDAPTPVNITNHAYWNLAGNGSFADHELLIAGPQYIEVDETKIPIAGPPRSVEQTRFDCRSARSLAEIAAAGGYDHCYVLDPAAEFQASLRHASGRQLDVATNQIGMQVYTGAHLAADNQGVALEPQCFPDTPNRPDFGDATVRPGDRYHSSTVLRLTA